MIYRSCLAVVVILGLVGNSAMGQDDEVTLRLKGDRLISGKLIAVDDAGITIVSGQTEAKYVYQNCDPSSAYEIRWRKLDREKAQDHVKQAEWCKQYGLLNSAVSEYRAAIDKDPSLKDKLSAEIISVRTAVAQAKFKIAKDIVDGHQEKKYESAVKILSEILRDYSDTDFFEEARKLDGVLAQEIKRANDQAEKDKAGAAAKKVADDKNKKQKVPLEQAQRLFEEGAKAWLEGLDMETSRTPYKAPDYWAAADVRLTTARSLVDEILKGTKEPDVIAAAEDLAIKIDKATVKNALSLALMYSVDVQNFTEGMRWVNKVIKIDPDSSLAWKLKLDIKEAILRMRIDTTKKN